MPRKHTPSYSTYRPQPTYSASQPSTPSTSTPDRSVNTILTNLRRSQAPAKTPTTTTGQLPTVPPSVQTLLGVTPPPPPPPRPRALHPNPLRRRIPGPPPPASWLTREDSSKGSEDGSSTSESEEIFLRLHHVLPDLPIPEPGSLQDLALRVVVGEWRAYGEWMNLLPVRYKSLLLSRLAEQTGGAEAAAGNGSTGINPLTPSFLRQLFPDDAEEVRFLDLSYVSNLRSFAGVLKGNRATEDPEAVPESWDADGDSQEPSYTTAPGFVNVTHLAVSTMRGLETVLECLPHITHLIINLPIVGNGGKMLELNKVVVRNALCLKYLEVPREMVGEVVGVGGEWAGSWRGVKRIVVRGAEEREVERVKEGVKGFRRLVRGGGGWCDVSAER